jgi:AcrR family transcriptional regulator
MSQTAPAKPSRQERSRLQLLEAATRLFTAYGLRRTTMEGIAQEAQVAKATAYVHFRNKEEAFTAVCQHVGMTFVARADAAAAAAPTPEAAVLASLTAKKRAMYELVHRSPHAADLLEAIARQRAQGCDSIHQLYIQGLAKLLRRCSAVPPRSAAGIATVLDYSASGLAASAESAAELEERLALLVKLVLRVD